MSRRSNHPYRFAPGCRQNSMMGVGFSLRGAREMVDMGPSEYASGEVTRDPVTGRLETYTIAPGDVSSVIGVRFCTDFVTILVENNAFASDFEPGKVLRLAPLRDYRAEG